MNRGDVAVAAGTQLVLHLHRFDDDERLARCDSVSSSDENPDHFARHGRHNSLRARLSRGLSQGAAIGTAMAAIGLPAPPAVEGDGNRRGADVNGQRAGREWVRNRHLVARATPPEARPTVAFWPHVANQ